MLETLTWLLQTLWEVLWSAKRGEEEEEEEEEEEGQDVAERRKLCLWRLQDSDLLQLSNFLASIDYVSVASFYVFLFPNDHVPYTVFDVTQREFKNVAHQYFAALKRCYNKEGYSKFLVVLYSAAKHTGISWALYRFMQQEKCWFLPSHVTSNLELCEEVPSDVKYKRLFILLARSFSYHTVLTSCLAVYLDLRVLHDRLTYGYSEHDRYGKVVVLYHVLLAGYNKHSCHFFWRSVRLAFDDCCLTRSYLDYLEEHELVHLFSIGEAAEDGEVSDTHQPVDPPNPLQPF